ncbi:filamin-B-like isoform X3 [Mizuhopecten yessoensis]|uniref:filamin-B-like isoform X3 n=1 Tax=Mizuhopecten yessoensis TaxID=6573 RepID=UPI000B45B67E|nr:filamin-B-like isoform X3 [Mizuhopecten yessoensis]
MSLVNRALSREGHAAMSMRGESDRWITIQKNTFTNWVNEQLRVGGNTRMVEDLQTAFEDGVLLCALIESLQGKKIGRVIKKPMNHHQNLENCTLALAAIANDNVRLVNIGSDDISNGNLKLILGLIWHLILRYQIGKTKFPAKKLMLAWLRAVIPECGITNFTSCWNDGVALHALVNYCDPRIEEATNWRYLSHSDSLNNCSNAMNLAKQHFDIPLVVRPEDLSSPDLDELSGMTYLSYFMKIDSPGYMATRNMVRNLLRSGTFNNFTEDWADGRLLCNLVTSLGESASPMGNPVDDLQQGIDAARRLGVEPILTAKEMCDPEVDHIGIMAYAAYFGNFKPVRTAAEKVVMEAGPRNVFIEQEADFSLRIDDSELTASDVRAEIKGPDSNPAVHFNWVGSRATGTFTPTETGHHRLNVYCENSLIVGCPVSFKVLADRSRVRYIGPDRCSAGLISELKVDVTSAGQGDIQCEARSPSGRTVNMAAVYRNGNYVMNFTPTEVGIWQVSVLYDGEHISDSPYNVTVFDPSRVRVYGLEGGSVGTGLKFHADTSESGTGDVTVQVSCNGSHVPAYIHQDRVGLYSIDFTPQGAGTYKVDVYFNDTEVRGSPYTLEIVDSAQVNVSGDGLSLVPVNRTASFVVDTHGSGSGNVDVEISAPGGRTVPFNIVQGHSDQTIEYVPEEVGDHNIHLKYMGNDVEGSPFTAKAYDTSAIIITPLQNGLVGSSFDFTIDVSQAGEGQLEIMVNNGNLPNTVELERPSVYRITFTPTSAGKQYVDINFNSEALPGSSYSCMAYEGAGVTLTGMDNIIPANRSTSFSIQCESDEVTPEVEVTSPSGSKLSAKIRETRPGAYCVEWKPTEIGSHLVEVYFAGSLIPGFPSVVKAFDANKVKLLTQLGRAEVGEMYELTFLVDEAGEGRLEVVVECEGETIPSFVERRKEGQLTATFTPRAGKKHLIIITFNDLHVPGSPFAITVEDMEKRVTRVEETVVTSSVTQPLSVNVQPLSVNIHARHLQIDKRQWFVLETYGGDIDSQNLQIQIIASNGIVIPARLVSQSGGNFRVEWTPTPPGRHRVEVQFSGRQVDGSPFYVDVFDLLSIRVNNFQQGGIGEQASFNVDLADAGSLESTIQVVSPSGRNVNSSVGGDYLKSVTYVPDEGGPYQIFVSYAGFELPGCPFIQNIDEGGLPTADGDGLFRGEEDNVATFYVDVGKRRGELGVQVDGPNSIAKTTIEPSGDRYVCTYVPVEVGVFNLQLQWNGKNIPGSPFHPKIVDPRKVKIYGGWQTLMDSQERVKLIVGEEKRLVFDVSQAGPGILKGEVQGPSSSLPVIVDGHTVGQNVICFTPEEEGNHYIHLFWAERTLPSSPFIGYAVRLSADANKVILTGRGLKEAKVREEAEFVIDGSQAGPAFLSAGVPEVTLSGVRAEINNRVVSLGNGRFHCTYTPIIPGAYLLHIVWNGRQLKGSPYKVNVIGAFFPHKVSVTGEGLKGGILGRTSDVMIDVRKAGPGELTAACMGPSKIAYVELHDNKNGTFQLAIKPMEVGRHVMQIKYGGEHVLGSPFIIKVGSQPDASKVRVTGPGVEHGILAMFQSSFVVETRGAGAGQLTVRIRGPKGGFQVEMYRDSQRDRTILCRYDPTETGLYILSIRWSGVDVPGSPFQINIMDTKQELDELLAEKAFNTSSATPRTYAQWKAEI